MNLPLENPGTSAGTRGQVLREHPSLIVLVMALALIAALAVWAFNLNESRQQRAYENELALTEVYVTRLATNFVEEIRRASAAIEREIFLSGVLSQEKPMQRDAIERVLMRFIRDEDVISQIRWVDQLGMERARLERHRTESGDVDFLSAEVLQDKSDRDYFRYASQLSAGEFYNSYLSLNQEFGEIVRPFQPVIRTATRTYGALKQREGLLVINFDVSGVIDGMHQAASAFGTSIHVLDLKDGRVYVSTEFPELAFSHELSEDPETLWVRFPAMEAEHRAFGQSGNSVERTPHVSLTKGWHFSGESSRDIAAAERNIWSRGGRVNMSPNGLLFDIRIPPSRIADDRRAAGLVLGVTSMLTAGCFIAFALLAFRLERRNGEALEEARSLAEAKSQFLANMSHEIRTPVTGVIGMLDLIETGMESTQNREKIRFVKRSAHSLRQIIDDILHVSKLQNGRIELQPAAFKPVDTLARVVQLYSAAAEEKGILLTASPPQHDPDVLVIGDEFRIEQVLNNLVSNAIKFTDTGSVTLDLIIEPRHDDRVNLRFGVADTGIGIDQRLIDQLGEPFFQVDASSTRKFGGTGLGLAICKSLLALMGSRLQVTSSLGHGTTISFDLDLQRAAPEHAPLDQQCAEHADQSADEVPRQALEETLRSRVQLEGPPRVLVVDDSPTMQMLIEAIFQNLNIPVTLAENGRAALEQVGKQVFDIVLMDLQMPEMGGVEATRRIRASLGAKAPSILILSATVQDDEIQSGLAAGANDFLRKPIDMEDLLAALLQFWSAPPNSA